MSETPKIIRLSHQELDKIWLKLNEKPYSMGRILVSAEVPRHIALKWFYEGKDPDFTTLDKVLAACGLGLMVRKHEVNHKFTPQRSGPIWFEHHSTDIHPILQTFLKIVKLKRVSRTDLEKFSGFSSNKFVNIRLGKCPTLAEMEVLLNVVGFKIVFEPRELKTTAAKVPLLNNAKRV